jgi:hypothetical protein
MQAWRMVWFKAGASQQAFAVDKFECIRQSQTMIIVNGSGGQFTRCGPFTTSGRFRIAPKQRPANFY